MITVDCAECGTPTERVPAVVRRHKNIYCSRRCKGLARRRRRSAKCLVCGEEFTYRPCEGAGNLGGTRKYCSRSCYAGRNQRTAECVHCGQPFDAFKSALKRGRKYCSWDCYVSDPDRDVGKGRPMAMEARRKLSEIRRERYGTAKPIPVSFYGTYRWKLARKRTLRRDGHMCQGCKRTPPVRLEVHHVIPLKYFGGDEDDLAHADDNLITLCKRCHSSFEKMTP